MEKIIRSLIDDLDGESVATTTVTFGYAGRWYQIDLNDEHTRRFVTTLAEHIDAGRLAQAPNRPGRVGHRSRVETIKREDNEVIREWGRANGHKLSDRGRIPVSVVMAYERRDQVHTRDECEDLDTCEVHAEGGSNSGGNKRALTSVPRADKGEPADLVMPPPAVPASPRVILEWAGSNGFMVHPRRKNPTSDMIAAYGQAHAS